MVRMLLLLLCIQIYGQETEKRALLTPVVASDVMNKLLECVELESVYQMQKVMIGSYRTMENELRYSLEFQRSEAERLKRVNLLRDEEVNTLMADRNALQKRLNTLERRTGVFSFSGNKVVEWVVVAVLSIGTYQVIAK